MAKHLSFIVFSLIAIKQIFPYICQTIFKKFGNLASSPPGCHSNATRMPRQWDRGGIREAKAKQSGGERGSRRDEQTIE